MEDFFHSHYFSCFSHSSFIDFTKSSLADDLDELDVIGGYHRSWIHSSFSMQPGFDVRIDVRFALGLFQEEVLFFTFSKKGFLFIKSTNNFLSLFFFIEMWLWNLCIHNSLNYRSNLGVCFLIQVWTLFDSLYFTRVVRKAEFVGWTVRFNYHILFYNRWATFRLRLEGFGTVPVKVCWLGFVGLSDDFTINFFLLYMKSGTLSGWVVVVIDLRLLSG